MGVRPKYDWEHVDWTKTDEELEELLGASMSAIYVNRKKYANKSHSKGNAKTIKKIDWEHVDWTKSDVDLAQSLNTSILSVSNGRARWAKGTDHKGEAIPDEWASVDWSLKNGVIAKSMNALPQLVNAYRKRLAPETVGNVPQRTHTKKNAYSFTLTPEVWTRLDQLAKNRGVSKSTFLTIIINKLDDDGRAFKS